MTASPWGRKVARLPAQGVLLVATDLQGNLADYEALKGLYEREALAGSDPFLLLCGDMVHGPDEATVADWPDHLGTPYEDRSAEIMLDYEDFARTARTCCLLGNHEHAHVGGPVVSKFHPDEAAVLDARLGSHRDRVRALMASFPLIAVSPSGVACTHGAPRATEPDLEAFERLDYRGYERRSTMEMHLEGTLGGLLWARHASAERARAFLASTSLDGRPNAFVVYGHDVVFEGFDRVGDEQVCVSTSFGLHDGDKTYLRLDLSRRYASTSDLRPGVEILPLYPDRPPVHSTREAA